MKTKMILFQGGTSAAQRLIDKVNEFLGTLREKDIVSVTHQVADSAEIHEIVTNVMVVYKTK